MNYTADQMCDPSPNDLAGISDRITNAIDRLMSVHSNLTANGDRAFGSAPSPLGNSTAVKLESIPSGMIGSVFLQLSGLERVVGDLLDAANRFNRL